MYIMLIETHIKNVHVYYVDNLSFVRFYKTFNPFTNIQTRQSFYQKGDRRPKEATL
jgi:hypothetical protein